MSDIEHISKMGIFLSKILLFSHEKTITLTLDPLLSYKNVILFSELERMILTQPPPSFLLDVTLFTVFFWNSSLTVMGEGKAEYSDGYSIC